MVTMATRLVARALLFTLTLATRSPTRVQTDTHVTASPPAFERTAAVPAELATAHTILIYTSSTGSGPPTAPPALTHGAPHSQIRGNLTTRK